MAGGGSGGSQQGGMEKGAYLSVIQYRSGSARRVEVCDVCATYALKEMKIKHV